AVVDGQATALALPSSLAGDPNHFGAAYAVNNAGVVAGTVGSNGGPSWSHAAIGTVAGGFADIGSLGGTTAAALGLNARGAAVGTSTLAGSAAFHAFLYDGQSMID